MRARLQPRYSPAARLSRFLGAFSFVLFLTAGASHRFGLLETVPFLWVLGLVFLLAITGWLFAISGFRHFWKHGWYGLKSAALGLLLATLVLIPYAVWSYKFISLPRLLDVSTDITDPPQLAMAEAIRTPEMNPVREPSRTEELLRSEAYPDVVGRQYEQAPDAVVEAVQGLVTDRGWSILSPGLSTQLGPVTVEALAHSLLLGFPADVAIRIEGGSDGTRVDMRSASRYGIHDLGDNALRIQRFLEDLDRQMGAGNPA